jgi:predicted nucleic acid-binding protein
MPLSGEYIYVLDACAVIAFLDRESGADIVASLIQKAEAGEIYIYMTSIQVLEVYYDRIRIKGLEYADEFLQALYASSIKIVHQISHPDIRMAGQLKTSYRLSLADSIVCAFASSMSAVLITADHKELEPVEKREDIRFLWFR